MDLGISKFAVTRFPNKSKTNQVTFKTQIQIANITYRNQPVPVLYQNEPYIYLGIQLIPSLIWNTQIHITTTKVISQCSQLANRPTRIKQKINMVDTIIIVEITYNFYATPYSLLRFIKVDKEINSNSKETMWTS